MRVPQSASARPLVSSSGWRGATLRCSRWSTEMCYACAQVFYHPRHRACSLWHARHASASLCGSWLASQKQSLAHSPCISPFSVFDHTGTRSLLPQVSRPPSLALSKILRPPPNSLSRSHTQTYNPSSPSIMPESPCFVKMVACNTNCLLSTPPAIRERVSREGCQCGGRGSSGSSSHVIA